jgi:hypothetical protein
MWWAELSWAIATYQILSYFKTTKMPAQLLRDSRIVLFSMAFFSNLLKDLFFGKSSKRALSYSSHMRGVALSILVMGLSLVAIILCYVSFGHIGPGFSADLLVQQQAALRKQFGLPAQPVITNETELLVPPSLRNSSQENNNSSSR